VNEQKTDPISGNASAGAGSMDAGAASLGPALQESASKESPPRSLGPLGLRLLSVNIASPKLVPEPSVSAQAAKEALMEAFKDLPKKDAAKEAFKDVPKRETPKETVKETVKEAVMEPFKEVPMKEAPKAASKAASMEAAKEPPKVEAAAAQTGVPDLTTESTITSLSGDGVYDESWSDDSKETTSDPDMQTSGKRRLVALAAVIALAAVSGAIGGALTSTGIGRYLGHSSSSETTTASVPNQAVEDSISRIDSELAALKELGAAESAKVNERIDKVEKIQAEPAAKIARLSDAMDKLRAPPAPVPASVAAVTVPKETTAPKENTAPKETTGSIRPPAAVPKPDVARLASVARLPTVEGWVLRDVADGGALIEGRRGMFEVFAGDTIPGLGRVDAIRRQDGSWAVVTPKGLIVAR
jgi:hypothetical protein